MTSVQTDFSLEVLHLRFTLRADTLVQFGPQAGGQLRGGLWAALRTFACTDPGASPTVQVMHSQHCPMCRLMALELGRAARGVNPPRPFAVRPPLAVHPQSERLYDTGETFTVEINLFGEAPDLAPYIFQGMHRLGTLGVGYGRGRFSIVGLEAFHPLTGEQETLLTSGGRVKLPTLRVKADDVVQMADSFPKDRVRLRFLTPTMLKHNGHPLPQPYFKPLIARLLERCQAMENIYTDHPTSSDVWRERHLALQDAADAVHCHADSTQWVQVEGGSRRQNQRTTLSGFVGDVVYHGDLKPFLPWLLWGQSLHVGKNVVKGSGWYDMIMN